MSFSVCFIIMKTNGNNLLGNSLLLLVYKILYTELAYFLNELSVYLYQFASDALDVSAICFQSIFVKLQTVY